ncbi:MAG: 2-C-methyl-D-erythritol 2,4-cyclodiphosphate synthase [Planctomycetes bacterium]|nr:2-C-methyl-D-erythritol 2,4-cyclodiphosphate synthase [Planctomycetota bacterium]
MRVGIGYDIHQLVAGRPLILGGLEIEFDRGCKAHSDGDVLLHAITDALLGAAGLGDIGEYFPDTDPKWKDADSGDLLKEAWKHVRRRGWEVENIDCNIIAQVPKLKPYKSQMEARIASLLEIETRRVNVKARTNEGLDAVGREEAIATQAVVLLKPAQ